MAGKNTGPSPTAKWWVFTDGLFDGQDTVWDYSELEIYVAGKKEPKIRKLKATVDVWNSIQLRTFLRHVAPHLIPPRASLHDLREIARTFISKNLRHHCAKGKVPRPLSSLK